MGKVVLISSQKSDVGKTIICLKIGIFLSHVGKKVLVVDLSTGKKKMSEYLNVNEDIIYDVKDVLDETCYINQAIIDINENLSLLPCPRIAEKLMDIKIEEFSRIFNEAKNIYDIIIADVDKISNSYIDFNMVDSVFTVNNNNFSCVKEINSDKHIAQRYNVGSFFAMLNKYNRKNAKNGTMMNFKEIQKLTDMNIDVIIEEDKKYINADNEFLLSNEENSFNKSIKIIISKI